jgi:hypothetical protein
MRSLVAETRHFNDVETGAILAAVAILLLVVVGGALIIIMLKGSGRIR